MIGLSLWFDPNYCNVLIYSSLSNIIRKVIPDVLNQGKILQYQPLSSMSDYQPHQFVSMELEVTPVTSNQFDLYLNLQFTPQWQA